MAGPGRDETDLRLTICIGSRPAAVRAALRQLDEGLASLGLPAASRGLVEMVLGEVLNNVVEHAYCDAPGGQIDVKCHANHERIDMVIRDCGRAMPDGRLPNGCQPDLNVPVESLPEGGFGWYLIRSTADRLVYSREDGRNRLEIGIVFDGTAQSGDRQTRNGTLG